MFLKAIDEIVYAEDCNCADPVVRVWWLKPLYFQPGQEEQAAQLHRKRDAVLAADFDNTTNEERYWAIHVGGRHVLHVR